MQSTPAHTPPTASLPEPRWPRQRIGTGASAGVSMRAVHAAMRARRHRHEAAARAARH